MFSLQVLGKYILPGFVCTNDILQLFRGPNFHLPAEPVVLRSPIAAVGHPIFCFTFSTL